MKNKRKKDDEAWIRAMDLHRAVGKILKSLRSLSPNERRRILNYFWDKYVEHPD